MGTWNDIYDSSDEILRRLWEKEPVAGFDDSEILNERLEQQFRYDSLSAYQKLRKHRHRRLMRWYGIAASVVLLLGLGWQWIYRESGEELRLETICPGNKKAILTLADGSVWHIGDSTMSISAEREEILVDSAGLSLRSSGTTDACVDETYHLLTIPRGGEFAMTLSDGSRVWLNSESELRFPLQFTANQRKVILTGEAYFEVEKDATRPFIVETNDSRVEVLGTSFNVRSYPDEGRVVTTLVEGGVCFGNAEARITLKPGEQGVLDESGRLRKQEVELSPYVAWREGRFIFRKQRLEDIMSTVGRWYNVEVRFEDEVSKEITFSGGMMRYEGFEVLVKMLETIGSVKCDVKGNVVVIAKVNK
ncbi:MAG: FecR domain-containing protein [Odoribacter sp.]|nr:FecR domain-containing protein [Odoribacter sp.]